MNIQKSELMILDKIRFRAGENAPQAPVPAPIETEQSAEKGMKALSFMGAKNLMSNPGLLHKVRNFGMAALITAAGLAATSSLTSCTDKETIKELQPIEQGKTEVNVNTEVNVDLSFLSAIMDQWMQYQKNRDAEMKEFATNMYNMFSNFYADFKTFAKDDKAFKEEVLKNESTMISLMVAQGMDIAEAKAAINKILNSNLSIEAKMDLLNSLVSDISTNVSNLVKYAEKAEKSRNNLVALAQGIYTNSQTLVAQGEQVLENDSVLIANSELIAEKLDKIDEDQIKGDQAIVKMLGYLGWSQEKIAKATKAEIVAAINNNTKVTKEQDKKILDAINKADTDLVAAKEEILEALKSIDGHILDLTDAFKKYAKSQKMYNFMSLAYAQQIANNTGKTAKNTKTTNALLEKLDNSVKNISLYDNGLADKMDSLISVIKTVDYNNQAGNTEIVNAIKEAKVVLEGLGVKVDGLSNDEILAELKKQTTELRAIAKDVATLKNQHAQGLINDETYAKEIIALIKDIKQDVASLALAIGDLSVNVEAAGKNYEAALNDIKNNTYYSSYYIQKLYEAYADEKPEREAMKLAIEELKPLLQNIDGTTTNIYQYLLSQGVDKDDIDRILKAISKASGDQIDASNANTTKVINAIDKADAKLDAQLKVEQEILDKMKELADKISPADVDLSKVEKGLADILAAIRDLDINIPDYSEILQKIYDKIKPCNCNCGELKVIVEEIKTIIEQRNSDEGIRNPGSGFIN